MQITGFAWLDEILAKLLRKHDVHEQEVVQIFEGNPRFRFVENGHRAGEHVYSAMGKTEAEDISSYSSFTKPTVGLCPCRRGT